jgi:hypothetical protein
LEGQQLPEEAPYAHVGVVITATSDNVLFSFVISTIWTIEGERHEARKADSASFLYLSRDYLGGFAQLFGCGANLATSRTDHTEFYG